MAWKLSQYSAVFDLADDALLLVNSFLGAIVVVTKDSKQVVYSAIENGIQEGDSPHPLLKMLCQRGYFIRAELNEEEIVTSILERERNRGFSLIILPHEKCNFRCVYCYENFKRGRLKAWVVTSLKKLVARHVPDWGGLAVQWFGGEPLLARDLIEDLSDAFIKSCETAGVHYRAGITTNGYYLTPNVARMLLDRYVRRFQITLDGPAKTHDSRRKAIDGKSSYERILQNLIMLKDFAHDFTVRIRVNFDPDSVNVMDQWVEEMACVFVDDARFTLSFHPIGCWGGQNDHKLNVFKRDEAVFVRWKLFELAIKNGFSPSVIKDFLGSHGSVCYAGRENSLVVRSDGRLLKCTVLLEDPKNKVGYLSTDGDFIIDDNKWKLWTSTEHIDVSKCDKCWFFASCQARTCPKVAQELGYPPCPTTNSEIKQLLQMITISGNLF